MDKKVKFVSIIGSTLFGTIVLVSLPLLYGLIVMLLWNSILIKYGAPPIEYWHSVGIYVLSGILVRKTPSRLGDFLFGNRKNKETRCKQDPLHNDPFQAASSTDAGRRRGPLS